MIPGVGEMFVKLPFLPLVEQTDVFPTGSTPGLEERVLLFITDQFTCFQIRLLIRVSSWKYLR